MIRLILILLIFIGAFAAMFRGIQWLSKQPAEYLWYFTKNAMFWIMCCAAGTSALILISNF